MKIYRTIQGDSFDSIAFKLWQDEHQCHLLMNANTAYMDWLIFPAGIELVVPDYTPEPKVASLPPWYGVSA